MIFSSFGPVIQHIRSGKLKALGVSVPKRFVSLPDVPTIAELGFPGFDFSVWTGIAVPAGTPANIREQINAAVSKALEAPEVQTRFTTLGFVPGDGNPQALKKKIADDHGGRIEISNRMSGASVLGAQVSLSLGCVANVKHLENTISGPA